jgi:hypothetical protein
MENIQEHGPGSGQEGGEHEIISEKFKTWTEGKNPLEARISAFNNLRDIAYAVVQGRDPKNAPEKTLLENKGSCTAKHILLKKMLDKLNIENRFVSHYFRWSDLLVEYPQDLKQLSLKMPVCDHLFCQAFIGEKWINLDVAWDAPLEKVGFPVNKNWDGISETQIAVKPLKEIIHPNIEERTKLKKELVDGYTEAEREVQPEFYKNFNGWLNSIRSGFQ